MDFSLSKEQLAFQKTARQFAANELATGAAKWDRECIFPKDVIKNAASLGFLSVYTPSKFGGSGLGRIDAAIIFEELAAGCTSTAAYITIHNMVTWMLATFGNEKLAKHWVPKLSSGDLLGSYCLTEPGSGSDAASLKTSAVRKGDSYLLNGSKAFISGAGETEVLIVMARTGEPSAAGISCFIVSAESPGISYGKKEEKMGWNSQPTRAVVFENVEVPVGNLLGSEGEGFKIGMQGLDGGRINIGACSLGAAQASINYTHRYLHEREQFGKSLASFQALQFRYADMQTELIAARQMVYLGASKLDSKSGEATTYCAMAKRFATDVCFNVCNDALQLHGGYGYLRDYPIERFVRDVRVHQILEGTNEIMRLIISRQALEEGATEALR